MLIIASVLRSSWGFVQTSPALTGVLLAVSLLALLLRKVWQSR